MKSPSDQSSDAARAITLFYLNLMSVSLGFEWLSLSLSCRDKNQAIEDPQPDGYLSIIQGHRREPASEYQSSTPLLLVVSAIARRLDSNHSSLMNILHLQQTIWECGKGAWILPSPCRKLLHLVLLYVNDVLPIPGKERSLNARPGGLHLVNAILVHVVYPQGGLTYPRHQAGIASPVIRQFGCRSECHHLTILGHIRRQFYPSCRVGNHVQPTV